MPSKEYEALVEKVARAIYERRHKGMKNIWSWDDCGLDDEHPGERERYIGYAQAAISTIRAALQEPNAEMLNALWSANASGGWPEAAKTCWQSVLAASALGEQSE